jgi:hypothetical protein
VQNKAIFVPEYQAVINDNSNTNVLKIINGKLKLLLSSNKLMLPNWIALG